MKNITEGLWEKGVTEGVRLLRFIVVSECFKEEMESGLGRLGFEVEWMELFEVRSGVKAHGIIGIIYSLT